MEQYCLQTKISPKRVLYVYLDMTMNSSLEIYDSLEKQNTLCMFSKILLESR